MLALLLLHVLLGLASIGFGRRLGRWSLAVGGLAPLATLAWVLARLPGVLDGDVVRERAEWVPALGIGVELRLDGLAALLVLVIATVGVLVFAYSAAYFHHWKRDHGRLVGLLTLFAGSMVGIALADDLFVLYTCWELTSITSFLLIGNDHEDARARAAAQHALLVTVAGGLAMLTGFVLVGQAAGTFSLGGILADPPSGAKTTAGLVLILLGIFTKSAQYPFHGWLPGAMTAPTPVSAFLHSATMVKAGVYLLARLAPVFAVLDWWRPVVLGVGLLTMIGGGLRALRQYDLKLLLAHGTVSQLGFLVVLVGTGSPAATVAGVVLLLVHALFKAALFMVVGILDHQAGTRDLRDLPPLGPRWRGVGVVLVVSVASMAGLPPVAGFVAKEAAYESFLHGQPGGTWVLVGLVAGSALTMAYGLRLVWGVLVAPGRRAPHEVHDDHVEPAPCPPPPSLGFLAPAALLATVTVVAGLAPALLDRLVGRAATSVDAAVEPVHLALWHGFNAALALSALTIAIGVGLFLLRTRVQAALAVGDKLPSGGDAYLAVLRGLNALADEVTGIVQNGSLPIYTGVILLTAAVLPGAALLGADWPGWPNLLDTPAHVAVSTVLVGAALAAATIRRRLSAALFLGVAGYGMAALFVVQGAPDLALTQVAIETLSTVLFVLVFRHFPDRFERKATPARRTVRFAISITVAVVVFGFALVAGSVHPPNDVSDDIVARAQPEGYGRNVVNVILVDFRAFDTMGEVTVLASAAIGMVALARSGRRAPRSERRAEGLV